MKRLGEIWALAGCTATGKTEWALRWARARGAEIVNCDALLFYRGMDIGTAKPSLEERRSVPHHLIDIREPGEPMDVARFAALAEEAIRAIQIRGRRALAVGGSGFYLKALFAPVADDVAVDDATREVVARLERAEGLAGLRRELEALEPRCGELVDLANPRRVARALERRLASGRYLAAQKAAFERRTSPLSEAPKRLTILERSPEELAARIERRVEAMLEAGLVAETAALRARGIERNPAASRAIGYRECLAYLDGQLSEEALAPAIAARTRQLARKQRSWFRSQLPPGRRVTLGDEGDEPALEDLFD